MRAFMCVVPVLIVAAAAVAQEPAPAPAPAEDARPKAMPAPAPGPEPSLTNVRVDLTLTDQTGTRPPVKKTMTLTLADGERGSVRSRPQVAVTVNPGSSVKTLQVLPLYVDARPQLIGNRIKLLLILEYSSADQQPGEDAAPKAGVNFSGQVLLDNGRPMVVAEAADPVSDRRVTVEVKATVLK